MCYLTLCPRVRLLRESLGGNSKTAMLATISPAKQHIEETLSTLRSVGRPTAAGHNVGHDEVHSVIIKGTGNVPLKSGLGEKKIFCFWLPYDPYTLAKKKFCQEQLNILNILIFL